MHASACCRAAAVLLLVSHTSQRRIDLRLSMTLGCAVHQTAPVAAARPTVTTMRPVNGVGRRLMAAY